VLFAIVAVVLGKGRTNPSASLSENIAPAVEIVEWYTLGGVVAFDRIVQNPSGIRSSWSISRFFLLTANKLGASFEVPSLHAEYTMISPSMKTNVYTMYFSYFQDYGWAGIVLLPYVLGYTLTWVYRNARGGSRAALVLYGLMFSGILLSGFNEEFFLALNTLLKGVVVVWLVFSLPGWWRRNRSLNTVPLNESRVPSFPASL
jgi:oligosaccharide repeat unit polymerase